MAFKFGTINSNVGINTSINVAAPILAQLTAGQHSEPHVSETREYYLQRGPKTFLGAIAKLRKATISCVMTVRLSA